MIKTALLATVLACVLPAAANAGDSSCVWRALPEAARASALRNYASNPDGDLFNGIEDEVMGGALVKCVSLPKNAGAQDKLAGAVGLALTGYIIQLGSEQQLTGKLHIEQSALERGYSSLNAKIRKDLAGAMESGKDPSKTVINAFIDAVLVAYPAAGEKFNETPEFEQFFYYFGGRALREAYEAKF